MAIVIGSDRDRQGWRCRVVQSCNWFDNWCDWPRGRGEMEEGCGVEATARRERGERRAQRATRSGGTESGARSDARDLGPPPGALRSERDGGEWASAGGTDGDGARRGGRADARRAGVHAAARRRREKVKARARGGAGARGWRVEARGCGRRNGARTARGASDGRRSAERGESANYMNGCAFTGCVSLTTSVD